MNFFRTMVVWNHPELASYEYMLQMDSDDFPTKEWKRDPIDLLVRSDAVYFYDRTVYGLIPQTNPSHDPFFSLVRSHFFPETDHFCGIDASGGALKPVERDEKCPVMELDGFEEAMGNFQLAELAFFRGEAFQSWAAAFAKEPYIYTRSWNDQQLLSIGLAILAPGKARSLESEGISLGLFHNNLIDDEDPDDMASNPSYTEWFESFEKDPAFVERFGRCKDWVTQGW